MRRKSLAFIIASLTLIFFFFATKVYAADTSPSDLDCSGGFSALFNTTDSFQYKKVTLTSPRTIVAHIVKVDLNDSNIDTATTPRQLLGNTTSGFLSMVSSSASIAINGSGYNTITDPQGYNASQGDVYSGQPGDMVYSSSEDNKQERIGYATTSPVWDVLSGVNLLIENGDIYDKLISCPGSYCQADGCDDSYCTVRARTSLGMDNDNQLIIIVTEENSSTLLDMAEMMNQCGARNAMNMDGGGSSTLAVTTPNSTGRNIINNLPGGERIVANHLAICLGKCDVPVSSGNNPIPEGEPKPDPYVSCSSENTPEEFHSLRPYQASPCNRNKEDLALFCGNDLFVGDNVAITKKFIADDEKKYYDDEGEVFPNPPKENLPPNLCWYCSSKLENFCETKPDPCNPEDFICHPGWDPINCGFCKIDYNNENRTEMCSFYITKNKNVTVDVSGAEFPIMGYTEPSRGANFNSEPYRVINSENPDNETVSNASKMNEYVSWYLNGVTGRAEYPYLNPKLDCTGSSTQKPGTCMDTKVDQSTGTLQCWGTWGIPFFPTFLDDSKFPDGKEECGGDTQFCCVSRDIPVNENTPSIKTVVNYSGPIKKLLPFSLQNVDRIKQVTDAEKSVKENAKIRHNQTVACHSNLIVEILGGWDEFKDIDFLAPLECYGHSFLGIPINFIVSKERLMGFLDDHSPPIEDQAPYLGENFNTWLMAYKNWRGNFCISFPLRIPAIFGSSEYNISLCLDSPLIPNIYGNVFSYIPFSSTEDRVGDVKIKSGAFVPYSPNVYIVWSKIALLKDADLFVPHMEEDVQLANLLQQTYSYKYADLESMQNSGFIPDSPYCDFVDVRSNPGDDLFAGNLEARIDYTAQITCTYLNWGGGEQGAPHGNLCENLLRGECVSIPSDENLLYVGTANNYGLYDCNDSGYGEFCVTNGDYKEINWESSCTGYSYDDGYAIHCYPNNFIANDGLPCSEHEYHDPDRPTRCPDVNFVCAKSNYDCQRPASQTPPMDQYCINPVLVNLKLEDRTPLANEAWAKLVAGSAGIFRKMFPQIGENNSTFDGIIDMPASTDVSYISEGNLVYAGNPSSQTIGTQAQLYFPHIGGIKEYFLTGIQTLLRPKGMGKQPVFCEGDECKRGTGVPPVVPIEIPPDSKVCDMDCENDAMSMITPGLLDIGGSVYNNVKTRAQDWLGSCGWVQSIGQKNFDQLYSQIITDSTNKGVNPVFTLAIWLHEFGASNYECVCESPIFGNGDPNSDYCNYAQDFGYNLRAYETELDYNTGTQRSTVIVDRFGVQLSNFLTRPEAYQTYCESDNFACPWEQFGALFHYGDCYSSTAANNYILEIREIYKWLAGNLAFPCYPISI